MTKVTVTGMDKLERQLEAITPAIRAEMKGAISDSLVRVHRAAVNPITIMLRYLLLYVKHFFEKWTHVGVSQPAARSPLAAARR